MKSKLILSGLVLGLSCTISAAQNIASNSAGCNPVTISGNSSQTVIMDGQSISNTVSNSSLAQQQVTAKPLEMQAMDAQQLELLIQQKMAAYTAKKAIYEAQLASYKASATKSRRAYRSLLRQADALAQAETEIDALTAQYDRL